MTEKPKKKILFVITKSNFGGAQRYVYDLATSLPKNDFDVAVAFGQGDELEQRLSAAGIRTIRIDSLQRNVHIFKDLAVFFELIRIYGKERPDVVHLNSTKIGGVGSVAGRLCGVPKIIFTAHGWAFNEKRNFVSKIVIAFLQWVMVMCSHITIAVSQKTADQILVFPFVSKNKIKVIYNGVDTSISGATGAADADFVGRAEARHALLPSLANQTESMWIGTVGELHSNKGLDIALTAFSKIAPKYPQTFFVIVGEGQERSNLTQQISELGLADRAFLLGFVENAKQYLKAFDIFTLTSRTEALPYVILESGLAELPVIATNVGGIPEIINTSEAGILISTHDSKKTPHLIASAIENFINDPSQAKKLGSNLKNQVTQRFSRQKMHSETFALYK